MLRLAVVCAEDTETADEDGEFRSGEFKELGAIDQQGFRALAVAETEVVAEAVGGWLERGEGVDIGPFLSSVCAAGSEGDFDLVASVLCGFFDGGRAGEDDEIGERDLGAAGVEFPSGCLRGW